MKLHTCPAGHLTMFRKCPVCSGRREREIRRKNAELKKENQELKRQIKNLTDAIAAGRAL